MFYIEPEEKEIEELKGVLNSILPVEDERKLYMTILCSGMVGKTLEKFINANGSGGNGKGVLNELMYEMSGEYAYNCCNEVLLKPLKSGNNVDVANMENKRVVFYREPDTSQQQKLNISSIKELTGGSEISATKKYSNKTKCVISGTHIIECNERPKINGRVDNAMVRRLIDIPFRSMFVKNVKDYEGEQYVFQGNDNYKTAEFRDTYKCALFVILIEYMKEYMEQKENIDYFICESVKKRTNAYLEGCDEILSFFHEHYERGDAQDVVCVKDIMELFRESDIYINMSKAEKRNMNAKKFKEEISKNMILKKYYKERVQGKWVKDKYGKNEMTSVFVGWKAIQREEEDSDGEDDINTMM